MNVTEIDQQQSPAFFKSAVEMSSDGSKRRAQAVSLLNEHSPRISEVDSSHNRDEPVRLKVDRESSSMRHVERLRNESLLPAAPDSTHEKSKPSMVIGMNHTISRLLNGFEQRYKTNSLFHRRKLRLENLSERRKALLPLGKRTNLDQPSLSKATQINRPTNKSSTSRPCCPHSYPLFQSTSIQTKKREHRRKRSTNEEDVRKLRKFLIRLLEATMGSEERTARNLTDLLLDVLLKVENVSRSTADERNINQTGIKNNTEEQKNQTLVVSKAVGKENVTGKSDLGGIGGTNKTGGKQGKKLAAEVGQSVQGGTEGFGEIGGPGDGRLIISAQILNGTESKELGQIIVNSKNRMEVAIKLVSIKTF